jgi:hypothetical protein
MKSDRIILKNRKKTFDPRLDRVAQFDVDSRKYPIRELVGPRKLRSYTWGVSKTLDQGSEGACVGFAWAHELIAKPKPLLKLDAAYARNLYKAAQENDEWPGMEYEGTSVLAGAKVIKMTGYMPEYRWAFGLQDLLLAVGYAGPGVAGLNWYEGMLEPDDKGFISPTGRIRGGHAIMIHSVNVKGEYVKVHNSWGEDWGVKGDAKLSFKDLERLLAEDGEFCVPVVRKIA